MPSRAIWLISGSGLVPFLVCLALMYGVPSQRAAAIQAFVAYSALTLTFLGGARPRIDEDAGAFDAAVVAFPHLRRIGADQVKMRAGLQPLTLDQRRRRQGSATDEVRLARACLQRRCHQCLDTERRQFRGLGSGLGGVARPDLDRADRPNGAMRLHQRDREGTGPDHQHAAGILADKVIPRQGGSRGGAPRSQRRPVDQGLWNTRGAIDQQVNPLDRRQVAGAIAGRHRYHLHADRLARIPGRHQQQGLLRLPLRHRDAVMMADRDVPVPGKSLAQGLDESGIVEQLLDLGGGDESDLAHDAGTIERDRFRGKLLLPAET